MKIYFRDSLIVGIAGEQVEDCVRTELKAEFEQDKINYFVPTSGPLKAFHSKTPLLLKVEHEGHIFCTLQTKTYLLINKDGTFKAAHKGWGAHSPENYELLKMHAFLNALFHREIPTDGHYAIVRGIRGGPESFLYSYEGWRRALSPLSPKMCYCSKSTCYFPKKNLSGLRMVPQSLPLWMHRQYIWRILQSDPNNS